MRARAMTGTFPFRLLRYKPRGWVRRKTEPKLSTIMIELPSVDVALPQEWEPTVKLLRRQLEQKLVVPLIALGAIVIAAATLVSS
jgi:hypothetical protein